MKEMQPVVTSSTRDDSHSNFHLHEHGLATCGEPHVACQHEFVPSPPGHSFDFCDGGLRELADSLENLLQVQNRFGSTAFCCWHLAEHVDVGVAHEDVGMCRLKDDNSNVAIRFQNFSQAIEVVQHWFSLDVDRREIERYPGNALFKLHLKCFVSLV
jgi:hypothetical protein